MTILFGGLDLGTPDGLIMGTQKESSYAGSIGANPTAETRTFVRLQERNASGIASRSTVAADKSLIGLRIPGRGEQTAQACDIAWSPATPLQLSDMPL